MEPNTRFYHYGDRVVRVSAQNAKSPAEAGLFRFQLERAKRFELSTPTLARWCSTTELTALVIRSGRKNTQLFALMAILFFDSAHFPLRIAIVIQKPAFREQREILQASCRKGVAQRVWMG